MKPNEKEPKRQEDPTPKLEVKKGAFSRVPGPGPKDKDAGAAGEEALDRTERT